MNQETIASPAPESTRRAGAALSLPLAVAVPAIALLGIVARIVAGLGTPLWFDETFSAVIASQPTAAKMLAWCTDEIGGPAYYIALWGWAQLFGTSAVALRALSFVASIAAVALVAWRGHPDRRTRLVWAALMALWLPALDPATNARCYALALLATTAQGIALHRLIAAPTRGRTLAWTAASTLAILTHSYCLYLALVGGLIFLAVHRWRALACWPAMAPVLLLPAWLWLQAPTLARFAAGGGWYPPFDLVDIALAPMYFFLSPLLGAVVCGGAIVTALRGGRSETAPADRALAASGVIAFALVLVVALVHPSFAWRYAAPFGPAVLFAVTLWLRAAERHLPAAVPIVIALFAASAVGQIATRLAKPDDNYRTAFSLEPPAHWLAAADAHHLAFLWDGPTGAISYPRRMNEVAGYFLRQHGRQETVTVLQAPRAAVPRAVVTDALAADRSIDSVLWIADDSVPGTHGPPDAALLTARGWACRSFGRLPVRLLACHR